MEHVWHSRPDIVAAKGAVLERHCDDLGRDGAQIARSAQVLVDFEGTVSSFEGPTPSVCVGGGEMQDLLQADVEAGVSEFIPRDWNLGKGQARRDTLDKFLTEVAAPFRAAG